MSQKLPPYIRETTVETLVSKVQAKATEEYKADESRYEAFRANRKKNAPVTGRDVRLAVLYAITSIKTDTQMVDEKASQVFSGDFSADKDFITGSHDGELKWEKYGNWFTGENADRVAKYLNSGRVDWAMAVLCGREPMTGEAISDDYLRATKASFVVRLLGFDRVCVDTRIFRAIEPALPGILKPERYSHPPSETDNRFRDRTPYMDAETVSVMSHSGSKNPVYAEGKTFWEDKLKWNVDEYHALTSHVMDVIAEGTPVPREVLPQVLFNVGRQDGQDKSFHQDILGRF